MIPHIQTLFEFISIPYENQHQTLNIKKIDRGQIRFREYWITLLQPKYWPSSPAPVWWLTVECWTRVSWLDWGPWTGTDSAGPSMSEIPYKLAGIQNKNFKLHVLYFILTKFCHRFLQPLQMCFLIRNSDYHNCWQSRQSGRGSLHFFS